MDYKVKETVTRENIITDIKNEYRTRLSMWGFLSLLCILIYSSSVAFVICNSKDAAPNFITLIIFICITAGIISVFCYFIHLICIYFTDINSFVIVNDELKESANNKPVYLLSKNKSNIYFRFAVNGYYSMFNRQTYYPWAEFYNMDSSGLYESADINDDFYLVMHNKRILCVYNKKMFELTEDIEKHP